MANAKSGKGNPAHTRMANKHRQDYRKACYARGLARKDANRKRNEAQAEANRKRRANGEATPWEVARMQRWDRRHPDAQTHGAEAMP